MKTTSKLIIMAIFTIALSSISKAQQKHTTDDESTTEKDFKIGSKHLSDSILKTKPIFTSLQKALQTPDSVYRLKIKGNLKRDSLPEELFLLKNLHELTVTNAKLLVLNQSVGQLIHLNELNLDHNKLVSLPESIGDLYHLRSLVISRNLIATLPESIGNLKQLTLIDAWDNPLYTLPESILKLQNTLKVLDLRQIGLRDYEYEKMELLLPKTDIKITSVCECNNNR